MKPFTTFAIIYAALCGASTAGECPDLGDKAAFAIHGFEAKSGKSTSVRFTRADILAHTSKYMVMERPWENTPVAFDGPLLAELISASGLAGKRITINSENNYSIELPLENADSFSAIAKMQLDGFMYSIREGGPLFLLHHVVSKTNGGKQRFDSYSIWKVCEIFIQ